MEALEGRLRASGDEAKAALDEDGLVFAEPIAIPLLRLEGGDEVTARRLEAGEGAFDIADTGAVLGPAHGERVEDDRRQRLGRCPGRGLFVAATNTGDEQRDEDCDSGEVDTHPDLRIGKGC